MAETDHSGPPRLSAAESGDGQAVLVLLHGFGGCNAVWDDLRTAFSAKMKVIAYDMPGHGGSLAFGNLSPKAAARALLDDLAVRGVEKAHLVGHSMGGAVAILAACLQPERIASLTLLAPGGIGPEINGDVLRVFAAARSAEEISDALAAMSGPAASPAPDVAAAIAATRRLAGQTATLTTLASAISDKNRQGAFPPEMLAGIACPVSVAWGREDPVLPFAQTARLPAGARLVALDNAGHMLIEEAPAAVAALIASTLS